MENTEIEKSKVSREEFPNKTNQGILLPILEMSDPYYPHSHLATSKFGGYYMLFFMYSIYFIIVYPLLNYLHGEELFGMAIIKLVQTNILWDFISAILFIFFSMIFIQISHLKVISIYIQIPTIVFVFVGSSFLISNTYQLYFTDRIFIIVLNWVLCTKTISYMIDRVSTFQKEKPEWAKIQKKYSMDSFSHRIRFLISPVITYQNYVLNYEPTLKIHLNYLMTKFIVSFISLMVNNIIIVRFLEPAIQSDLSFIPLIFKLFPLTFYINISLYYMVMDNVLAALAEITKMKKRVYYLDWWNAQNVYQFADKWCLLITQFTDTYFSKQIQGRVRQCIHNGVLLLLLFSVFGKSFSIQSIIIFIIIEAFLFALGGVKQIQNNYIVHILTLSFTPVFIALEVKYSIFD